MLRSVLICALTGCGLFVAGMIPARAADKAAKAAAASAETEAREHVHQALLAETLGDNEQRAARLAKAWLSVPDLPEANWQMGRVRVDGKWLPLAEEIVQASRDPNQEKYRELREKAASNVKSLRDLARWCRKQGWQDRAQLHYAQVLSHSGADAEMKNEAVKELDLHQVGSGWITGEELAARNAKAKAIEAALSKWRPKLMKLQLAIEGSGITRRDRAIEELNQIADPTVIPVLESFLTDGGSTFQEEVVKALAKFPQYEATEAIVHYAVLAESLSVREEATRALKHRPTHEYAPLLLAGLVAPLKSQFQVQLDPRGNVGYTHAVVQEGPSRNLLLVSHQIAVPQLVRTTYTYSNPKVRGGGSFTGGESPLARAHETIADAVDAAAATESQVRFANSQAEMANRRILATLQQATGNTLPPEPSAWWKWWDDYNEYNWPKPTSYAYQYGQCAYTISQFTVTKMSCFVAGTPVRAQTGQVAIESIKPGDRVLAQDQDSGELAYKSVLTTTLRPPSKMIRIKAGGEEIVTTLGHPFWVDGHGWKMAKQLKEGDLLHSLGGALRVESVEPLAQEKEAYNLVVDDFNTYFVGQQALLVHDNEFRKPTRAIVPGLVADESASK